MKQSSIQRFLTFFLALVLMTSASVSASASGMKDESISPFRFTQYGSYSADLDELAARRAWVYGWLENHPLLASEFRQPLSWGKLINYLRAACLSDAIPNNSRDRTDKPVSWMDLITALQSTLPAVDYIELRRRVLIQHTDALTCGEALQVLCALADLGSLDPNPVHSEMLRPSEVRLEQLSSVDEALYLVKLSVQTYGAKQILVSFTEKISAQEKQRFQEAYDLNRSTEDTGLQCCVDPRYSSPLFTCKESDLNHFRIEINHLSPALLAHVDTKNWIRAADLKNDQELLQKFTHAWINSLTSIDSEVERSKAAVNWVIDNVDYDTESLQAYGSGTYVNPVTHDLKGAMLGSAVCDGQSLLLQFLLLECGIDSYLVTGGVDSDNITHMWVKVKLSNCCYFNIDPTWCNEAESLEDYFLHSDVSFQSSRHVFCQNWQTKGPYAGADWP